MELGELDCASALRGSGIVSERVAGHAGAGAEEGTVDGETEIGEWIGEVAGETESLGCWYADWAEGYGETGDTDAGAEGSGGTGGSGGGSCGAADVLADLGGLGEDVELGELPIRRLSVSQGLCDSSTPRWGTAVDVPTEIVGEEGSARWR